MVHNLTCSLGLFRSNVSYILFLLIEITVLGEWWAGIDFKLYVENTEDLKYVGKESSVIICNHYSDIDWLTAWIFAERNGFVGVSKFFFLFFFFSQS